MSWLPKTSRTFRIACGLAVSASAVAWAAARERDSESTESEPKAKEDSDSESGSPFLGKVLASWTTNFKPTKPWDSNWDRRDPKFATRPAKSEKDHEDFDNRVKQQTPTASRHLLFIRHGQYNMDGDNDAGKYLTLLGREQASYTGKRLKELNFPYTLLVQSTMTRAKETAEIIHKQLPDLPVEKCDLLREGAPIPPEPPVGHWRPEASFYQDGARIEAAFRKYIHRADPKQEKDSYEIIVCHANVIRYFACRALQVPPEAWLRMSLNHASLTWITVRPSGRVSLRALGDSGHIPPDKLSVT